MADYLGYPKIQCFDTNTQLFLAGGKLYTYIAGTETATATYSTPADAIAGTNANTNPIILDSRGEAIVVLTGPTKLRLKDANDNTIWTVDGVNTTSGDILDGAGNALLTFTSIISATNYIQITNAATGQAPRIDSVGSDTNIGLKLSAKGGGVVYLDGGTTGDVLINTLSSGDCTIGKAASTTTFEGNLEVDGSFTVDNLTAASIAVTGNVSMSGNISVAGPVSFFPAGIIIMYAGSSAPSGYLECDGSAISRTTWATLFAAIGTTYGAGNGTTTFNLPNFQRRVPMGRGGSGTATIAATIGSTGGAETHTLTTAEMPAHTHTYTNASNAVDYRTGAATASIASGTQTSGSTGGGGAHNNVQPCLVVMYIVKAV